MPRELWTKLLIHFQTAEVSVNGLAIGYIIHFIPHSTGQVISYPCWDKRSSILVERDP